ncbi:Trypsin [Streptomyces lavendulae subsp. lavendulae]|uniref:Trypsin n=1 Tax=Streptomyces lavendulae subsp. lavendulae TaxID=58340 RepID=A0A2K8PBB4_STRLA|nr:S1 family peptidase [Streptomyces lavendulae]ATZ23023.1 Trypsin [Streptomyces lavendulae subsp. lavendulae]QUQ52863.1 hypothetical protein SLLC_03620 [Streptomyces lavendulae subsp. lavendulae]
MAGPEAAAGQLPSVVKLGLGNENDSRAYTGVLVDRFWVLTAAGCFAGTPGTPVPAGKPALKTTATLSDGKAVEITEIVPRDDRDAALVRLATAVTTIKPTTLAAAAPAANAELTAAGFGRTKTEWVPDKLHSGTFTVNSTTATTLAITGKGTDVLCKGDTGGPLLNSAGQIAGVNSRSWQSGCLGTQATKSRTGAISTRTDDLAQWINTTTYRAPATSSDFNGDGKTDLALTGGQGWTCLPVAISKGDGTFNVTCNTPGMDWGDWAAENGVKVA